MTNSRFDAVVIGSGINGLVAGALLARSGWRVALCERNAAPGGAIATTTDRVPGFTIEQLSSWHPLFVGGPAYAELADELARRGVQYANTAQPTGVVCAEGTAVLSTDPAVLADELDRLGDREAWQATMRDFGQKADLAFGVLGTDFWRRGSLKLGWRSYRRLGRRGLLASGAEVLEPATAWLDRTFSSPVTRCLLAPWALHNGLGPDDASSAFISKVIAAAISGGGMPVPVGGGRVVVDALVGMVKDAGGELLTETDVTQVIVRSGRAIGVRTSDGSTIEAERAILASVPPGALYDTLLAGTDVPGGRREAARAFRHGRACMQIHIAMREEPKWAADPRLADTALVHVLDSMDSLSESVNAANRGYLPARPTIAVGQPCTVDPSRAPEGQSLLWLQLQEVPREPRGDLAGVIDVGTGAWTPALRDAFAERVIDRLERHITNIRTDALTGFALGPADLEAMNANLVGGDPYGGDCRIDQYALWRPLSSATGHGTGIHGLWHIGASTHPGPGLGAGSGYLVADRLR